MQSLATNTEFARNKSIQWGSATLARCFSLRGNEQGYGIPAGDAECAHAVELESLMLATQLWGRAVVCEKTPDIGFGAAAIFDCLVLDLCAYHRRECGERLPGFTLACVYHVSKN